MVSIRSIAGVFENTKGKLFGAGLMGLAALSPNFAAAEEAQPVEVSAQQVNYETSLVDAAQDLRDFTDGGGVGIIFHYKAWEGGYTAQQLSSGFVNEFAANQTDADVRVVENDRPGARVFFVIKDVSQGPYSAADAFRMIEDIADQNRFAHGLQTSMNLDVEERTSELN